MTKIVCQSWPSEVPSFLQPLKHLAKNYKFIIMLTQAALSLLTLRNLTKEQDHSLTLIHLFAHLLVHSYTEQPHVFGRSQKENA